MQEIQNNKKILSLNSKSPDDLDIITLNIIDFGKNHNIWAFYGEMGAGKTTLIQKLCKALNVNTNVQSPTFSLINHYKTTYNKEIYHFDFYRINNSEEALDLGIDEYFENGNLCMVEWPEKISSLLPENILKITINLDEEKGRKIVLQKN